MTTIEEPAARPKSVLANAYFRNLWLGAAISLIGDQFYLVALPWLVLQLTGSSLAVGAVLMCAAVPRAVLMLAGGAVSDRIAPRRIMLTTASLRTVLVGAVGALAYLHIAQLWHLYILAFAFGTADAFALPAMQALLPSLVEREQLSSANALFQSLAQITTLIGPAPAGAIIKAVGVAWAFFIDAFSFLFIIVPIYGLPRTKPAPKPRQAGKHFGHDILAGLHYVWRDRAMRDVVMLMAGVNFFIAGPIIVGLAALAKFRFGSPTAFGALIACWSGGALLGVILSGVRKQRAGRGWTMIINSALVAAGVGAIGLLARELTMGILLVITGIAGGYNNIVLVTWFQERVEHEFMGRVMSVLMFGWVGLMPISYPLAGALAQWSISGMFVTCGVAAVAVTGLCATAPELRKIA